MIGRCYKSSLVCSSDIIITDFRKISILLLIAVFCPFSACGLHIEKLNNSA